MVTKQPTFRERVKELFVETFGSLACRHRYTLMVRPAGLQLRCAKCGHETEMFRVSGTNKIIPKEKAADPWAKVAEK